MKEKEIEHDKKKIAGFLIKFFLIFGVLHFLLLQIDITFFQKAIASFQAGLLGAESDGISVFVENTVFLIVSSCTGLVSAIILGSIIFSLKKPVLKQKIIIFLIGTILLLLANQVRLFIVLLSGKFFGLKVAEAVHVLSWFATTVAIIFAWYYFTKKLTKEKNFNGFL